MVNNLFKVEEGKKREVVPDANDVILHPTITDYKKDQHEADVTPFRSN